MVIMCLSLMIYNVGEYLLKSKMKEKDEEIENLVHKLIKHPTLKMVFILMRAIDLVKIKLGDQEQFIVTNLTENHEKILEILGPEFIEMYEF